MPPPYDGLRARMIANLYYLFIYLFLALCCMHHHHHHHGVLAQPVTNPNNGHMYLFLTSQIMNRNDAVLYARNQVVGQNRGYLATITSQSEYDWILSRTGAQTWFHLGAGRVLGSGQFVWQEGPEGSVSLPVMDKDDNTHCPYFCAWWYPFPCNWGQGEDYMYMVSAQGAPDIIFDDTRDNADAPLLIEYLLFI
eukprot:TRINITY_DN195_c1_g2_i3.p1 TRINITY_DN195_c1_g2~~TRINITY_DN195_c1_g2_i3.p1  ORF type:complete len:194 (+),score=26.32 TRINITY_DN195_c1_g2_i3:40-621(+)